MPPQYQPPLVPGGVTFPSTGIASSGGIGLYGTQPGTVSTGAPISGFYRTAAVVGTAVGWIGTNSVYTATFSVETQVGNPISPGNPVMVVTGAALPTNALQLGNGTCTATNTIVVGFFALNGGINTTTVSFHVFSVDIVN